jgi:putative SOS response-associated peptidase YedK
MCYDISFDSSVDIITAYFPHMKIESQVNLNFEAVHLVAHAYPKYPIVIYEDGKYDLRPMEWGLIAPYMNTQEKIKEQRRFMLNARSEKILDKKSIWNKVRNNRCLIPVSGIYEHREINGWKNKVPYYV